MSYFIITAWAVLDLSSSTSFLRKGGAWLKGVARILLNGELSLCNRIDSLSTDCCSLRFEKAESNDYSFDQRFSPLYFSRTPSLLCVSVFVSLPLSFSLSVCLSLCLSVSLSCLPCLQPQQAKLVICAKFRQSMGKFD